MAVLGGAGIVAASAMASLATTAAFSGVSDTRSVSAIAGLDTVAQSPLPDDLVSGETVAARTNVNVDEWAYSMGGVGLVVVVRRGVALEVVSVRPAPG